MSTVLSIISQLLSGLRLPRGVLIYRFVVDLNVKFINTLLLTLKSPVFAIPILAEAFFWAA